ncbi:MULTISPECIES: formate dehydrogenase accessory sulfurtransferase FdhD [Nocardia]|uniref:formate dehydrogenase accessory sulfurtransferase FdhD n=1 Tax=Nocardia TaxID=1817 RepID=UPI001894D3BC|nr:MULTISPECIES: formate dehydrogenase accessory sulfurtransferase FdhD [Nocardia]MBF6351308.1 formate dehydrogenase accessory sulfurtransferase FdhD [Nocardia flavorosea]
MSRVTARRRMRRITPAGEITRPDTLAVEEPLEIRVRGESLAVTMRTPGNDIDLVHGFLFAESLIAEAADIRTARYCAGTDDEGRNTYNVLDIDPTGPMVVPNRPFLTTGACGLCGKTALDEIRQRSRHPLPPAQPLIEAAVLAGLPDVLRRQQTVFDATGGLHAAGLFTAEGDPVVVREDIGRHNAVDKVIGWALRENRIPASDLVLVVSGRASFELAQKAVLAGIPILAAVSAPSSLAVDLAADSGLTLAGFVRGDTMNIYTGAERVAGSIVRI